jgi:hypothetical protein
MATTYAVLPTLTARTQRRRRFPDTRPVVVSTP